jgi:RNA polymerase sigma-70 factor (ECF subfamily)
LFSREKKSDKAEMIEQIICEKYNSYYRMAYSFVKNESDAEDIVQEGAYRAMKNCDSLKNTDYAATWIYRIMMNETNRFLAERKRCAVGDETLSEPEYHDTYVDVDLERVLQELSDNDRAVIQMKYFEELKLEEISSVLGENLSTVKSRLYRALKKLRAERSKIV